MPNYQQFGGYPNVVGNFTQGLDAGRARAMEDFNTRQTMETQNALVQQSGAQSYSQYQAMQMQAKQMLEMYGPTLQNAVDNRNYEMRDAIADHLEKTGNPMLSQFAKIARTATKIDDRKFEIGGLTFKDTQTRDAYLNQNPQVLALFGGDKERVQVGREYKQTWIGMPGTSGAYVDKFEPASVAQPKPTLGVTTVKSDAEITALEAKYKDRPDILDRLNQARLLLANSPGGVDVSLPEAGGVKAVKSATQKDEVDFPADAVGSIASLIARPDVSNTVKDSLKTLKAVPGQMVRLEGLKDGQYTRMKVIPPKGGAGGAAGAQVQLTDKAKEMMAVAAEKGIKIEAPSLGMGTAAAAAKIGVLNRMAENLSKSGKPMNDAVSEVGLANASRKASSSELAQIKKQRGPVMAFARTAELNLNRAINMVDSIPDSEIPIINRALRSGAAKIAGSSEVAAFYAALYTGVNEYAKVTSSATGGGVSTNAAREEAADALGRGGYTAAQYKAVLQTVLLPDLMSRKQGYDERIKETERLIKETSGRENEHVVPSLDEFIKTRVAQYPQYKNKTRVEWQKAYDQAYPSGQK